MSIYRAENRIAAGKEARAVILGHPDVTVPCQVLDFSKSGLCIRVEKAIASGMVIKVEWDDHFLVGRAQRTSAMGKKFRVGLELLYCSKWNETMAFVLGTGPEESLRVTFS